MTERPILFSGPMVRAILDGRKTQTRRLVKPQPQINTVRYINGVEREHDRWWPISKNDYSGDAVISPYGIPGDRLWVRETWKYSDWTEDGYPFIGYRADDARVLHEQYPEDWGQRLADTWADLSVPENYNIDNRATDRRWRPGIHMPRWACRLVLEVTVVRVERLQAISAKDIIAEGAVLRAHDDQFGHNPVSAFDGKVYLDLKSLWAAGWDSINAKRAPWSSNPWVWVIEFRTGLKLPQEAT